MVNEHELTDCAEEVNDHLNSDLQENAYHKAMLVELTDRGIPHTTEANLSVRYKGFPVARRRPDLVVGEDEKYVLELKARTDGTEQLESYMDLFEDDECDVVGGMMISFGESLDTVVR